MRINMFNFKFLFANAHSSKGNICPGTFISALFGLKLVQQSVVLFFIFCLGFTTSFAATITVTTVSNTVTGSLRNAIASASASDMIVFSGITESYFSMDGNFDGQTNEDGVCVQLSIIVHPTHQYSCGGPVTFAVTATDATDYRWQRSSDNGDNWVDLNDGDYGLISGAATPMLTAAGASLSDINGTLFRCQVYAEADILSSNPARFTFGTPLMTIGYGSSGFCSDADPVEVVTNGYSGGLYSAEPAGLSINTTTGQIIPASSVPGTYTVTYTLAAQNDCPTIITTTELSILDSGTASLWYADADGDGFGDAAVSLLDCGQPNGYVADNTDCDDANDAIYPGAFELCNGIDDDCDGNVDDNCCPDTGTIWYVAADAATVGNGASWSCAFQNLQDAINAAGPGHEIWVKAGTYKPTQDPFGNSSPSDPRNKTFYLKDGVAIYGGFAGTEITRNLRDWSTHVTTLSGDFNDDDGETTDPLILINNTENAFHALLSISDTESTVLDGFTVKGGNANDESTRLIIEGYEYANSYGGGMHIINSSITIDNTIFTNNTAYSGGGMYISFSNPSIRQSTYKRNTAIRQGAGVFNNVVSLNLTDAVFRENHADLSGGGMYSDDSNLTISNVLFSSNAATSGAGMGNFRGSSNISNAVFIGNQASSGSGGGISNVRENMIITNARFSGNSASFGGGIWHTDSLIQLIHCTFSGNDAQYLATALYLNSSESILKNCLVWNNRFDGITGSADASLFSPFPVDITYSLIQGWNPAGTGNLDGITYAADSNSPQFVTPLDPATAPSTAGDFHLQGCSPAANVGDNSGAPATDLDGNPRIFNTTADLGAYERQTYSTAPAIWYADADGDTFGNPAVPVASCTQPAGYVGNNTDCNDLNNLEKPGQIWFKDTDNDGYGQTGAPTLTQCLRPVGYKAAIELISPTGDCNDNNNAINPAASEVCDGIDNDCDGTTDGVSILPCGWNAETNGVNLQQWKQCVLQF